MFAKQGTIELPIANPSSKNEELQQLICSMTVRLDRSQKAEEQIRSRLRLNLPVLRSELLHSLLSGELKAGQTLKEKLDMCELPFAIGERCRMLLLEADPPLESHSDRGLFEYALKNVAEETLDPYYNCWPATSKQRVIVFLIKDREVGRDVQFDACSSGLRQTLERVRDNVRRYLNFDLNVFVSEAVSFPDGVEHIFRKGMAQIYRRSSLKCDVTLFPVHDSDAAQKVEGLRALRLPPSLIQLAVSSNVQALSDKIGEILAELESCGICARMRLLEAHMHLLGGFVSMAHANGRVLDEIIGVQAADPALPIRTVEQLRAWSQAALERIVQAIRPSFDEDTHGLVVGQVKKYVREQMGNNLALQVIAEQIYWHPSYLSKIFKEKTGVNLSDYIQQERNELAKSLLTDTSLKIYEIAAKVGYQSAQPFIREFKKCFGVTPKCFRIQSAALRRRRDLPG